MPWQSAVLDVQVRSPSPTRLSVYDSYVSSTDQDVARLEYLFSNVRAKAFIGQPGSGAEVFVLLQHVL
jgi:hypothetical protein